MVGCSAVYSGLYWFALVAMGLYQFTWVCTGLYGFALVYMGLYGLAAFTGLYWAETQERVGCGCTSGHAPPQGSPDGSVYCFMLAWTDSYWSIRVYIGWCRFVLVHTGQRRGSV